MHWHGAIVILRRSSGDVSMTDNHRSALLFKHSTLESQIIEEERRPFPDSQRLHSLKREKLRLKDEIQLT
jgi:uncharacterized protein